MNRSIARVYLATIVAFALLAGFLGWWQVVRAKSLASRQDNPYLYEAQRTVDRGRIFTADGVVLARSVVAERSGQTTYRRVYPNGTLAPHVVGYATPELGNSGVEAAYNEFLGGDYGSAPLLQRLELDAKQGADVQLTIDSRIQRTANEALAATGRAGAVVAVDPRSGAILAMSSNPSFDLRDVAARYDRIRSRSGSPLLNRATQSRQPPGSTFKVVTTAAALQNQLAEPTTTFTDTGSYVVNGIPIRNFGGARYGVVTLETSLTKSINTTFARLGEELGADRLGAAMDRFGFGASPDLTDLPETEVVASGRFRGRQLLPSDESGADAARMAIGQERVLATPLQMAIVAAAVADRGRVHRPYLVARVRDRKREIVKEGRPDVIGEATSPGVAAELSAMMRSVVKEGTGTAAALSGLEVAGKTGTAEVSATSGNMAWFIGFAPADNPRIAVAVRIENTPSTGGAIAAPAAAKVLRTGVQVVR